MLQVIYIKHFILSFFLWVLGREISVGDNLYPHKGWSETTSIHLRTDSERKNKVTTLTDNTHTKTLTEEKKNEERDWETEKKIKIIVVPE